MNNAKWLTISIALGAGLIIVARDAHRANQDADVQNSTPAALPAPKRARKEISISYKEERLNGQVFVHRDDWDHIAGKRTQSWLVDGVQVDQITYAQAFCAAEKEQQEKERAYEQYVQKERQERVEQIAKLAATRLLDIVVASVEVELKRIDDEALKPFYQFGECSIASVDQLDDIRDDLLPKARKMARAAMPATAQEMQECVDKLEKVPMQLRDLFYDSVEHAIAHADDPKLLKKWLAVVSSSEKNGTA